MNLRHLWNTSWNKVIRCTSDKPVLETVYDGKKCFTFYSDLFDWISNQTEQKNIKSQNTNNILLNDSIDDQVGTLDFLV